MQRRSPVAPCLHEVGRDDQRPVKVIQGFGGVPETLQDHTKMIVRLDEMRIDGQCASQQAHGLVGATALRLQQPKVRKSTRVLRVDGENVTVQILCPIEFSVVVQGDRLIDHIPHRCRYGSVGQDGVGLYGADGHDLLERGTECPT